MPVVDFSAPKGGCDVTIQKFVVEADSANDAFTYKLYLTMPLASRAEAEAVAEMLPGLADSFDKAGEDDAWKATTSVKPGVSLRVVLAAKEVGAGLRQGVVKAGEIVLQGTAELVELKANQSKRARIVVARLVFRGQAAAVAERLTDNLSRTVALTFEQLQAAIPFPSPGKVSTPRPGMIVAATAANGEQVVGRVVEVDGDELSLQESGSEITVEASAVITAFSFSDDADTRSALSSYAERCERRGVPVSWAALVSVLGVADGRPGVAGVPVTLDHVEAAVAVLVGAEPAGEPEAATEDNKRSKRRNQALALA